MASGTSVAVAMDCQPMQARPAMPSASETDNCRRGTAPSPRLPITVTATGRKPITSEVMAMPPSCTAEASST